MLLREAMQEPDGTLNTKFLKESLPQMTPVTLPEFVVSDDNATCTAADGTIEMDASNGTGVAEAVGLPVNYRISFDFEPNGNYDEAGLFVRGDDKNHRGYKVELNSNKQSVFIYNTGINTVKELDRTVRVDLILKDEFIDMNVNGKRSIINRLPEKKGDRLFFFLKNGKAEFKSITISRWNETEW